MSIEVILDVRGWSKEMAQWCIQNGCKTVEVKRFGESWTSYQLNNCKPFHFYRNSDREVRMFFWRDDQGIPLIFMMQFPDAVFSHNMETTLKEEI